MKWVSPLLNIVLLLGLLMVGCGNGVTERPIEEPPTPTITPTPTPPWVTRVITVTPGAPKPTADDDKLEVGIEWVTNVPKKGLSECKWSAQSFYDQFALPAARAAGWTQIFNWGNGLAWERDFKCLACPGGGADLVWADDADIVYFCGHGNPTGFFFSTTMGDRHLDPLTDAVWGDQDLEWLVLHSCLALAPKDIFKRWGCTPVFSGLHGILGFASTCCAVPDTGLVFAYNMIGRSRDVWFSWMMANFVVQPPGVWPALLRADNVPLGRSTENDHLHGFGKVAKDPNPPTRFIHIYWRR